MIGMADRFKVKDEKGKKKTKKMKRLSQPATATLLVWTKHRLE
jgi:hypothetical protein